MLQSLPVERFSRSSDFRIPDGAVVLYGTLEERSLLPEEWRARKKDVEFHEIFENDSLASFSIDNPDGPVITLRRRASLAQFMAQFHGRAVFMDYSGLSHHVWMPIVREALEAEISLSCIYSEPAEYQPVNNPRPGEFFDLSEKVRGIQPVPTFSKLNAPPGRTPILIPLLGYEGTRFKYVVETLQPEGQDIFPVVGVPGFRLEFPFHSFRGNADALSANRAWENMWFADASCPFSAYLVLQEIQGSHKDRFLQISPVGTKPHALGAAMYAVVHSDAELVYDHPIRKKGRTVGAGRCHVYHVSKFISGQAKPRAA
jgi:hypothetical protein